MQYPFSVRSFQMAKQNDPAIPAGQPAAEGEMSEAEIDQNLKDSFPASDPPSWTLGITHSEDNTTASRDTDRPDKDRND
jgi:hypothetical protein